MRAAASRKILWVAPATEAAAGAALEAGVDTLLFDDAATAAAYARLGRFRALVRHDGTLLDGDTPVGVAVCVTCPADVDRAASLAAAPPLHAPDAILVEPTGDAWSIIPAENLVAAWQGARRTGATPPPLFMSAATADAALTAATALEAGTDGVLLTTGDPVAVKQAAAGLAAVSAADALRLTTATVTAVTPAGVGDRVCADLTTLLAPGEGLLVGSFAAGALLVASERDDSAYVPSRPFRVNAGAVHSYVATPGGRTAYLAELSAGSDVLIVGADGATRRGVVGRAKVEARPMLRVDVAADDGAAFSVILQNAETVKLVAPRAGGTCPLPVPLASDDADTVAWVQQSAPPPPAPPAPPPAPPPPAPLAPADADALAWVLNPQAQSPANAPLPPPVPADAGTRAAVAWAVGGVGAPADSFCTISVADLRPGDRVLLHRAPAARHTGLHVDERVLEK